jgi:septum site-determining protein MinD
MVSSGEMLDSADILDILSIDLLGKIPEDRAIIEASNTGKPIILNDKSLAGAAYKRICKRLCGEHIEFEDVETFTSPSLMGKIKSLFQ